MMLKVGLTGNIGSGKTIIAGIFSTLGVAVYHADLEARKQFDDEDVRKSIREIFGPGIFSHSGEVLRHVLAETVFKDPSLLDQLNKVIHPRVLQDYNNWCRKHTNDPYTVYESAILFESGHYRKMDKVICVTAPVELRIKRVMERDGLTRQEVENRIANQWDEEKKVELSDFVVKNDETVIVTKQVLEIHNRLVQRAKGKGQS